MMNQKTASNGGTRPVRMWAAAALLALASVTTGCPGNQAECQVATDCAADQVCNASNVCVTPTPVEPEPGPDVNPDECANVFCSGQGQCAVANGEAVCICNAGYSPSGLECIEDTDSCDGVDCSGSGTCAIANGAAVCICDDGFDAVGLTCIASTDPCNGITCSGQGNCAVSAGNAVCICNNGFTPNGLTCVSNNDPCAGVTCSGQGTCASTGDTVSCTCNTGYSPNGLQCIADGDPCEGVTCSGEGTCAEVNGAPQCNCNAGFSPEGLTCVADVVLDGGTGPGPVVPETWTCSPGAYDDGTCDCGCGAVDEDCADATDSVCVVNHCDEGTPKNTDNSQCFPSLWLCNGEFWGDDDCDCGCGLVDIDCPASTSDVCEFTLCQDGNDTAKPTNNAVCYPDTWACSGDFYDDTADVCDCGCGIPDPDCDNATVGECAFCAAEGSCSAGSNCPGAIDPTDNSSCDCVPVCAACREVGAADSCGGTCEANCAGTCNGDVCVGAADIASLELTVDSATATAGEDILVRHRYGNLGGQATGDFDYAFFLHTSATNVQAGTRLRTFSPLELQPGESRGPFAVSLTVPPGTSAGTYFVGAVYDVEGTVTESDEGNNSRTVQITVGAGQADLTVSALSVDVTTLSAGDEILATYTRINNGSSATGGFVDGFFLSSDPVITPNDTLQRSNNRLSLAPGEQLAATAIPVTIGSGTPPGTYYFGYFVDVDETVAESDETNNYRSVQIVVQGSGLPDLRPQGFNVLTTAPVAPGDLLAVEYSRVNQGDADSGPFHFSVRLSDNNVITTLDEEVFGLNASSIAPGGVQGPFSGINVNVPNDLHAGVYWAGAIIDDTNAVTESNEDNNTSNIREFFVVPNTCDKYIQFGLTAAGQTEATPYVYYDGPATCSKVQGFGDCLDNDTSATATLTGYFADTTHGDSFPTIYGGFPSTAESDDYFAMHVDDNFGATLDIEVSLAGDDATGDLDLEVYFVCDTSDPTASGSGGTTCQSSTAAGEPAVLCRNFNATPDETVTFSPNCDGFDEGGTVYVRVNRFGNYAGCAPYSISGHF